MRKILKNFIFISIFIVLSILIILINFMGYDDKNILLIGLNPILNFLVYQEGFRNIIWNEGPNFNMYIAHLVTFIIYGVIIDMIRFPFKSMIKVIKSSKN
ncbi:hypothetical protein [Clostridium celatum]|uniref:Uncharacterized protein n=1 Tax=Clostridium celatum DSM 1785 TaxID=545697 RepID=L1QF09_9CLOT|nr:hypothetical protein [Clostridium celatum]EKY26568.1 hypothetical protein HMPREF0216_01753 [Clostridium celatum DSM 1785]